MEEKFVPIKLFVENFYRFHLWPFILILPAFTSTFHNYCPYFEVEFSVGLSHCLRTVGSYKIYFVYLVIYLLLPSKLSNGDMQGLKVNWKVLERYK